MAWQTKKLNEIVNFSGGLWTGKKEPFKKVKVLRNTNFRSTGLLDYGNVAELLVEKRQLESRLLEQGDIILEKSGGGPDQPVGRVVYFDNKDDYSFSNFTCCIRIKNKNEVYPKFLWLFLFYQYISGVTERMQKRTTGIRNLIMPEYKEIKIPLPLLSEQKKIVKILDEKMGKIAEAKKIREEVLTDTEKILARTMQEIFEEGKKKGWEDKEMGRVCKINPNKNLMNLNRDEEVTFVPMRAVDEYDQEIKTPEIRKIKEVEKGYTYFAENDVLFAKITPCMENGKVAIARNLKNMIGFGTTEFHVIRVLKDVLPEWIYQIIRQPNFREKAKKHMTGSAGQKRVPKDFLDKFKISVPPISEQQKIVARLDTLSGKIKKLKELQKSQLEDFEKLEKSYLREAFNGESV